MKTFEEKYTAWIDGQLSGQELIEFEQELAKHPDALRDKLEAQKLGKLLRDYPAVPVMTNPDFFNHHLLQQIAAETERAQPQTPPRTTAFWPLRRLAFAGAFCLLLAGALFKAFIPTGQPQASGSAYFAQVVEAWPASNHISATTVYNPESNVTVVWLDGLDFIPASQRLE